MSRKKFGVGQLFITLVRPVCRKKFSTYHVAVHIHAHTHMRISAAVTYRENGIFRVLSAAFSAIFRETNRGAAQANSAIKARNRDIQTSINYSRKRLDARVDKVIVFCSLRGIL